MEHQEQDASARGVRARRGSRSRGAGRGFIGRGGAATRVLGRTAAVVFRFGLGAWSRRRPAQQVVLGFALYSLVGWLLLCLPLAQEQPTGALDNAFNAVSAVSTTGLAPVSISDSYTFLGEFVVLAMLQLGGIGFMTVSSMFILARGGKLSESRLGVLRTEFALPRYFVVQHFVRQVVVFTLICELVGAGLLWWRFAALGVEEPLWSAVFHSVSAFATAGFSLNNNSMEPFAGDWIVNVVIGALSYFGAIGFIVVQDVWYSIKLRERMLTFTTKVILWMTAAIFAAGTALLFLIEPSVQMLPVGERLLACTFQVVAASTTSGFNTIPIGGMSSAGLVVIVIAMVIGASPSGTGGGIKTTSVSALLANLLSVLFGRERVIWLGHEVPMVRVLYASAATTLYLLGLTVGCLALCVTERLDFLPLVFEAASAIGTVGLSMGATGELSAAGKLIIITLMFAGRCGPLTIGLALVRPQPMKNGLRADDLAV